MEQADNGLLSCLHLFASVYTGNNYDSAPCLFSLLAKTPDKKTERGSRCSVSDHDRFFSWQRCSSQPSSRFLKEILAFILRLKKYIPDGFEYGEVVLDLRRHFLEETNDDTKILAANRTLRKDPLRHFRYYRGGWDIKEKHYLSSVGFTAAPFFIVAAFWFIGFGLCLLLTCACYCCFQRRIHGYSKTAYAISFILLGLSTIMAIGGSVVLYAKQEKFHSSSQDTLNFIVQQAESTVESLGNVSSSLQTAKHVGVNQVFLPSNVLKQIDHVNADINSSASSLEYETRTNNDRINNILRSTRLALIILAAVMLFLALLGFLFSVRGLQSLVHILVVTGWILITISFVLSGVFFILHNVVGDTCVAMDEWVQNPTAKTALDEILPCVDSTTAQETLIQTREVTSQLINITNQFISTVANADSPPSSLAINAIIFYNQSGPLVPFLCDPFGSDKTDLACGGGAVSLQNATQVWNSYICKVSSANICISRGRLTPTNYQQMVDSVNVCSALYRYGPFLVGLEDCTFVRDAFSQVSQNHCAGLSRHSKWVYFGLALASASVMLSLIFWVIYARERRHRRFAKQVIVSSSSSKY